jgi:5'-nucleotidase
VYTIQNTHVQIAIVQLANRTNLNRAAYTSECTPAATPTEFNLNILHVNDHHSYIDEYSYALDTSSLPLSSAAIKSVNIKYGGFPRIVQYLNTFNNNKYFPNVLKLHAGDALTGTLWYTLFKGDADARMMGYACFDAFELGNHEFDDGTTPESPTPFEIMSIPFFLF